MDLTSALVGGLVSGLLVAVVGAMVTLTAQRRQVVADQTESREQRHHEQEMAREARAQDRRADAYVRIMRYSYRLNTWVLRTEPMLGPVPDPPGPLPDDDLWELSAITSAYASPEVQGLSMNVADRARAFEILAWRVRDARTGRGTEPAPRADLHAAREEFGAAVRALAEQVNVELGSDRVDA